MVLAAERVASRAHGVWVDRGAADQPAVRPALLDHDLLDHGTVDRGTVDRGTVDHGTVDHRTVDRGTVDHGALAGWAAYRRVNAAFAAAAAERAAPGATVWVLGHRLQMTPGLLRRLRPDLRIGLYVDADFPSRSRLRSLPHHQDLLRGLLGADLIGFPAATAVDRFLAVAGAATAPPVVGVFPYAADTPTIQTIARRPDVGARARALRRQLGDPPLVLLRLDQPRRPDDLDSIERHLAAAGRLASQAADRDRPAVVIQVLTPPEQRRDAFEAAVDLAVRRQPRGDHDRVRTLICRPTVQQRVVLYLAADILVALSPAGAWAAATEYAAAARDESALVLPRSGLFASGLADAYLVDAADRASVRDGLAAASTAPADERVRRLRRMRQFTEAHDCHTWAGSFLAALRSAPPRPRFDHPL